MRAGQLRHTIELQHSTPTQGATGHPTMTWATYGTVHARIETTDSDDQGQKQQTTLTRHTITIRYRSDVEPTDRIKWGARHLNIKGNPIPDERFRELQITAIEVT